MKPLVLTLALAFVPSVAYAAGGIGTAAHKEVMPHARLLAAGQHESRARCNTVRECHRALTWQKANRRHLRHLLTVRFRDTVNFAVTLAARAYHLDEAKALSVAWCESRLNPFATNGQYAGLFQIGPRVNATPFAGLDLRNPFVNALAAGAIVTQDGGSWREWTCG